MPPQNSVPLWLWRAANHGLILLTCGLAGLAGALLLGAADPPRAGPLQWQDDFKSGLSRWEIHAPPGLSAEAGAGALRLRWEAPAAGEATAWALTPGPAGDFTLEVAGASATAVYGLVYAWHDSAHYSAVLLKGSGYAEAYTQRGPERQVWFAWQQWPHILAGGESNRLRVDARGAAVTARINDEILVTAALAPPGGRIGLLVRGAAPAQVVFSWVRLWAP